MATDGFDDLDELVFAGKTPGQAIESAIKLDDMERRGETSLRVAAGQLPFEPVKIEKMNTSNEAIYLQLNRSVFEEDLIAVAEHFARFTTKYTGVERKVADRSANHYYIRKPGNGFSNMYVDGGLGMGGDFDSLNPVRKGGIIVVNGDFDIFDPTMIEAYLTYLSEKHNVPLVSVLTKLEKEKVGRRKKLEEKLGQAKLPEGILISDLELKIKEQSSMTYQYYEIPFSVPVTEEVENAMQLHYARFLLGTLKQGEMIKLGNFKAIWTGTPERFTRDGLNVYGKKLEGYSYTPGKGFELCLPSWGDETGRLAGYIDSLKAMTK